MEKLTERESQVLEMRARGKKRSEIARELGCTVGAVSIAAQRAKAKLEAKPKNTASIADAIIADGGPGRLQRFAEAWAEPVTRPSTRDDWQDVAHILPPEMEEHWRKGGRGHILQEMAAWAEALGYLPESLHRHRAQRIASLADAARPRTGRVG